MEEKERKEFLSKLDELKSMFAFGLRFVPFLEELLIFVQEMTPMLNEMDESIRESSGKIPEAGRQLDRMNSMLGRLDEISRDFQEVSRRVVAEGEVISEITGSIEKLLKLPDTRDRLSEVFENEEARELGVRIKTAVGKFLAEKPDESLPDKVSRLLEDAAADATDILNAFQAQDITSQQIENSQAMLGSIQERLDSLIARYSEVEPPPETLSGAGAAAEEVSGTQAGLVADEAVELEKGEEEVEELPEELPETAEALPEQEGEEELAEAAATQEEIDSLFGNLESEREDKAGGEAPISEAFEGAEVESAQGLEDTEELP